MNTLEYQLTVVGPKPALPPKPQPQQLIRPQHPEPDPDRVLDALRSAPGFDAALERAPGLGTVPAWVQVGYYSVCSTSGPVAVDGIYLFGASFPGALTMLDSLQNCFAYFAGAAEPFFATEGPSAVLGYVVCPLEFADGGHFLFALHVETGANPYDPDAAARESRIEICIDNETVTTVYPAVDQQSTYPVLAELAAGRHLFQIVQQGTAGFYFQDVTVWQLPVTVGNPLP